jgi:Icc-related predicted phosphoesterase
MVEDLPRADLVIVAGDLTLYGTRDEAQAWAAWAVAALRVTRAEILAWIPGNHDCFDAVTARGLARLGPRVVRLPEASACTVLGLRVWASSLSSWQPEPARARPERVASWHGWAPAAERRQAFAAIPPDLDLLVTHAPPAGVLSRVEEGPDAGDPVLAEALAQLGPRAPRAHVFGHIHEGAGQATAPWGPGGGTRAINAAYLSRRYTRDYSAYPTIVL